MARAIDRLIILCQFSFNKDLQEIVRTREGADVVQGTQSLSAPRAISGLAAITGLVLSGSALAGM